MRKDEVFANFPYYNSGDVRWIRRDGKLVLQQQWNALPPAGVKRTDHIFAMSKHLWAWRDVAIVEDDEDL